MRSISIRSTTMWDYPEQPSWLLHFCFGGRVGFTPDNRVFAVASNWIAPHGTAVIL